MADSARCQCGNTVIYHAQGSSMALQCTVCFAIACCECAAKASLKLGHSVRNLQAGFEAMPCPRCPKGHLRRADAPLSQEDAQKIEEDAANSTLKLMAIVGAIVFGIT